MKRFIAHPAECTDRRAKSKRLAARAAACAGLWVYATLAVAAPALAASAANANSVPDDFPKLQPDAQASWLLVHTLDGSLAQYDQSELLSVFHAMSPRAFIDYMRDGIAPLRAYQFEMTRRERHAGMWPSRPDHMQVRYETMPQRIDARWLPDGAHGGQEVVYDAGRDPKHAQAHMGGALAFVGGNFDIDGSIAHVQSKHRISDLGLQYVLNRLQHDYDSYLAEGADPRPQRIEVVERGPVGDPARHVVLTWFAPSGPPAHYAQRVAIELDLRHPWPLAESAWDGAGVLQETVRFDHVVPGNWDHATFQLKPVRDATSDRNAGQP